MSLPTSIRAYRDCEELFVAATADPKGVRACLGTHEACVQMRTRMHYYRSLDREANARMYAPDHPMHMTSAYDHFVVQILQDEDQLWWLYVQPRTIQILHVEGLSEVGEVLEIDATEVRLIEDGSKAQ